MKQYVAGLMFDANMCCLALVEKNRPDWQAGLWNGIGGQIEDGEFPRDAMRREFREEAGVDYDGWMPFVRLYKDGEYEVLFFVAYTDLVHSAKTLTDEKIHVWPMLSLPSIPVVGNLRWLVSMAADPGVAKGRFIQIEDGRVG